MTPEDLIRLGFAPVEVAAPSPDGHGCSCRLGDECRAAGKHPLGRDWLKIAVANRERRPTWTPPWARLAPATSYGLVPVAGSRMIVVDRDDPDVLLPLPPTFEVHRPSAHPRKGHYYFRLDDGIDEADVPRGFAGGDVRVAQSGHVVGPGCRHKEGDLYEGNDHPVGIADRALIDHLSALKPVRRGAGGEVDAVEGSRHAFLVGQARRLAGWGRDEDEIVAELELLNETVVTPPLPDSELPRIAEWAARSIKPDRGIAITRMHARPSAIR